MIKYFQKRFVMSRKGAKDLTGGIFASVLMGITTGIPVGMLYMLMQQLMNPDNRFGALDWRVYVVSAVVMGFAIFWAYYLQYNNTYVPVYNESAERRISLAERLRKLPLSFFGRKNMSDVTNIILQDATDLEITFSHAVPQLFGAFIILVLAAIGLSFISWQMMLSMFWVAPAILLLIIISKKFQNRIFAKIMNVKLAMNEKIQEGMEQIQEIKAYSCEQRYIDELSESIHAYEKVQLQDELKVGILNQLIAAVIKLGLLTLIIVGSIRVAQGTETITDFILFLVLTPVIYGPILALTEHFSTLFHLDARLNRMKRINNEPLQHGIENPKYNGLSICFDKVDFTYNEGNAAVLHDVSFTANEGEVTALVGPSGGGKSTTAKLAARFWDVNKGKITLGGVDISTVDPETLLKNFSIVFQDVVLFNASVMENIRIGRKDATDEEVMHIARLAQCDEFVNKLPEGYQTLIGENGSTLSGGERQRISIARALLKDAPIILLDEATASLDAENETKIQLAISELVRGKTVIVIAHRMRTIINVDHIVVLKGGRVEEQGAPAELFDQNGHYTRMVRTQTKI